jgi:hypothetical protein
MAGSRRCVGANDHEVLVCWGKDRIFQCVGTKTTFEECPTPNFPFHLPSTPSGRCLAGHRRLPAVLGTLASPSACWRPPEGPASLGAAAKALRHRCSPARNVRAVRRGKLRCRPPRGRGRRRGGCAPPRRTSRRRSCCKSSWWPWPQPSGGCRPSPRGREPVKLARHAARLGAPAPDAARLHAVLLLEFSTPGRF